MGCFWFFLGWGGGAFGTGRSHFRIVFFSPFRSLRRQSDARVFNRGVFMRGSQIYLQRRVLTCGMWHYLS